MLKLNRLTDYAVVVLGQLARNSGKVEMATEIAMSTGIPLPTVSKILKILSSAIRTTLFSLTLADMITVTPLEKSEKRLTHIKAQQYRN